MRDRVFWWQWQTHCPQGAAASSDKQSFFFISVEALAPMPVQEKEQQLNARHCPQPRAGDGMRVVAVTDRDISVH